MPMPSPMPSPIPIPQPNTLTLTLIQYPDPDPNPNAWQVEAAVAQQAALQGEEKALVAQMGRLHEQVAEAQRALARKGAETVRCMGAA